MKPTLLVLALLSIGGFFALRHPAAGRWQTDAERGHDIVLESSNGHLHGDGGWALEAGRRCPVSIDMSFVSDDARRYIGKLDGHGECAGVRTTLDCTLAADEQTLDCGDGLVFRRR